MKKSEPKNYEYNCRPATARVKSSETSRDLNGYLEPLTHLCTDLNTANETFAGTFGSNVLICGRLYGILARVIYRKKGASEMSG